MLGPLWSYTKALLCARVSGEAEPFLGTVWPLQFNELPPLGVTIVLTLPQTFVTDKGTGAENRNLLTEEMETAWR